MTVKRVRRGFAVVSAGQPYYLHEGTKTACEAWIERCEATRAELAAFEAAKTARAAVKLAALGIGPIDFRALQAGDLYATRPDGPVREVTSVNHLGSGATQVFHDASPADRACGDMGHLLLTAGFPVYGLLRRG
jgi:hypothetical protein